MLLCLADRGIRVGHAGPIVAGGRNAATKSANTDTTDTDGHDGLLLQYLRLSRKRVGLLINFNVAELKDGIRRKL
jgi:hypothetical protein